MYYGFCRYNTMQTCWRLNPGERPTFSQLIVEIENLVLSKHKKSYVFTDTRVDLEKCTIYHYTDQRTLQPPAFYNIHRIWKCCIAAANWVTMVAISTDWDMMAVKVKVLRYCQNYDLFSWRPCGQYVQLYSRVFHFPVIVTDGHHGNRDEEKIISVQVHYARNLFDICCKNMRKTRA